MVLLAGRRCLLIVGCEVAVQKLTGGNSSHNAHRWPDEQRRQATHGSSCGERYAANMNGKKEEIRDEVDVKRQTASKIQRTQLRIT